MKIRARVSAILRIHSDPSVFSFKTMPPVPQSVLMPFHTPVWPAPEWPPRDTSPPPAPAPGPAPPA